MGRSWNLDGGRTRRGIPGAGAGRRGPSTRHPAPLAPEHRPREPRPRPEVPARRGFWFRHPVGPVGVPSVGCRCLASPRDQPDPARSGGLLGAVREACCYLLKDPKNTRKKKTLPGSGFRCFWERKCEEHRPYHHGEGAAGQELKRVPSAGLKEMLALSRATWLPLLASLDSVLLLGSAAPHPCSNGSGWGGEVKQEGQV